MALAADDAEKKDPQFAYTLAKGLEVLSAFGAGDAWLTNREIAALTAIPRPTVARLTRTLSMLGYLKYDASDTRYRLAVSMLRLVYPLLSQLTVRQLARPLMQELAAHARGSVSIGMRSGLDIVVVETCVENPATSARPEVGVARPIILTAFGRAYLAGADPEEREAILKGIRQEPRYDFGKFNADLKKEIARFRAEGFCVARDTHRIGFHAVAVPFRMNPTADLMVFNCAIASYQLHKNALENDIGPRLVHLKQNVEMLLGTNPLATNLPPLRASKTTNA
jgi:DNA-binding IclR family transcriptional regulator